MNNQTPCQYCDEKGYTEIRDCGGDIQRTEKCSFCEGLGYIETTEEEENKNEYQST